MFKGSKTIRSPVRRSCGFTIIEVVVASALLMIVFVAILSTISTSRRIASVTENRLACMHMAREILETMIQRSYDSSDFAAGQQQLPGNRGFVNITQVSSQRVKDVEVVINWVEPSGMNQSVSLATSHSRSLHR